MNSYIKSELKSDNIKIKRRYHTLLLPPPPAQIVIDPINICNLDCPLCPSKIQHYPKSMMPFHTFVAILDKLPFVKELDLFKWGEPLLHEQIIRFIEEAASRTIQVIIHTNFSFYKKEAFFEELVASGLAVLMISLDGISQASYGKYRRKGNFDLVLTNIKSTIRAKKKLKMNTPLINWKFIINKYNEGEMSAVKKLAMELKITHSFMPIGLAEDLPDVEFSDTIEERMEKWLPANKNHIAENLKFRDNIFPKFRTYCNQLFTTMVINPDGKVFPCCWTTDIDSTFGDLTRQSFAEIWYGEKYLYARSLFNYGSYTRKKQNVICNQCRNFIKI